MDRKQGGCSTMNSELQTRK